MSPDYSISVVIPCYNGWKYMGKCLSAIENQTLKPYEIIIVDDCSTDDSYKFIANYCKSTSLNIILVSNPKNSGPGATRNKAIALAKGAFIAFCDCDDWYENEFVEKMTNCAKETGSDLVICDNYVTYDDRRIQSHVASKLNGLSKEKILANYKMSLWRLLVKKELLNGISCPPLYNGEDGAMVPVIIAKANKIGIVEDPLYNYYFREGSLSNKPSKNAWRNLVRAFDYVEIIKTSFPRECEFLGIKMVCYGATLNALKANIPFKEIRLIIQEFDQKYPQWNQNPYLKNYSKIKRVYLYFIHSKFLIGAFIMARMHYCLIKFRRF